jgi:hypothetical protein
MYDQTMHLDHLSENPDRYHDAVHSARHLTGRELDRLLSRYDLNPAIARLLAHHEAQEAWWCMETYSEQLSERGRATRHWTRLERHHRAHPVHGPYCLPPTLHAWDDDDIPF